MYSHATREGGGLRHFLDHVMNRSYCIDWCETQREVMGIKYFVVFSAVAFVAFWSCSLRKFWAAPGTAGDPTQGSS